MEHRSVAIDGPAGAGKSTLARAMAQQLNFRYVDTGAIYRTVALGLYRTGQDVSKVLEQPQCLEEMDVHMDYDAEGLQHMYLNGEDVTTAIREHYISAITSQVAAHPNVRAFLLEVQRKQANLHDVVMDGRDIGTVVLPHADVKGYLTASPEERARRRYLELEQKGDTTPMEQILQDIIKRDEQDKNRPIAPLRQAEDAVVLDTTTLNQKESLDALVTLVRERLSL